MANVVLINETCENDFGFLCIGFLEMPAYNLTDQMIHLLLGLLAKGDVNCPASQDFTMVK